VKLKTRFALSHGLVVAATLLACLLLFRQGASWMLSRQELRGEGQLVQGFAVDAREAAFRHEDLGLIHTMQALLKDPSVLYVAFANPTTGTRLALPKALAGEAWQGLGPGVAMPHGRTQRSGAKVLDWALPLDARVRQSAWIEVGFSPDASQSLAQAQIRRWTGLAAGVLLLGLLLGLAMALLLSSRLVDPLRRISQGTHLVRSGRLDGLVEVERPDEIGDLARDFNAMVLQLKELDEMKRDFVAGVTHDFGSPLHALRSTVDHLLSGDAGPLGERQAEYLLMVSNNLASLTAFVNNLLSVARIEAAKAEPYFEPVDVLAHVTELMKLYESQAQEKGLDWALTKRGPYLSLEADVTMFRQIVMNLLSNALKFTDQGKVEVLLAEEGGELLLEVRDTGIGIDPKYHGMVFDKFFRVHQDGGKPGRQGSGLGLSIVKGLAELHGGSVSVDSALGQGAAFLVRLPKQARRR
jgi:signal transduction histidine kinase